MTSTKDYRSDSNGQGFSTTEERDRQLRDDMIRMMNVVEENMQPTPRWWHRFIKPKMERIVVEVPDNVHVLTEQEQAERRAFLDGYNAGRQDGDAGPAYKLWYRIKTNT